MANTGTFNISYGGSLKVELHRQGVLGLFRRTIAADCLQFSLSGIRLATKAKLRVGESLVLDLTLHDLRIEELPGTVRGASAEIDRRCYEIDFSPTSAQRGNTLHCLRHIDSHIRAQVS